MKRAYSSPAIYFIILFCGLVTAGCIREKSGVKVATVPPISTSTSIDKSATKTKASATDTKQKSDKNLGVVVGRMTDFSGKSIANAAVDIIFADAAGPSTPPIFTDKNGIYRIEGLYPGDKYTVHGYVPTAKDFVAQPMEGFIKVRPGKVRVVNLQGEMIPPHIRLISPHQNSVVKGDVIIKARVSDNYGVQMIVLYGDHPDEDGMLAESKPRYDNHSKGARRRIASFKWNS